MINGIYIILIIYDFNPLMRIYKPPLQIHILNKTKTKTRIIIVKIIKKSFVFKEQVLLWVFLSVINKKIRTELYYTKTEQSLH